MLLFSARLCRGSHANTVCVTPSSDRGHSNGVTLRLSRAAMRGVSNGGGFPIWTCPSFFVLFCPFWDLPDFSGSFLICPGALRGFSRSVLCLFLGLFNPAYYQRLRGTVPKGSATQSGLVPKIWGTTRFGNPPGLASLKLSSCQFFACNGPTNPWPAMAPQTV